MALGQELFFIQKINELLTEFPELASRYRKITVRVVELGLHLDYPSKLDRDRELIERLLRHGEERADWFFDARSLWPREGTAPAKPVRK